MNKTIAPIAITFISLFATAAQAQDMPLRNSQTAPAHIIIDGQISEWGDSLRYYSPAERLNYSVANTKDTLYVAIKVYDRSEVARIMHEGITLAFDPKGKKKETFSITFPLNVGKPAEPFFEHDNKGDEDTVSKEDREELMRERITTLRGIKVTGFKDVEDENITTSNTYGFQTAIDFDASGNLICEAAIPMHFFHADDPLKNQWAFDIKINGIQMPARQGGDEGGEQHGGGMRGMGGGGGMGGMGGGGRHGGGMGGGRRGGGNNPGVDRGEMVKTVDYWVKVNLTK